MEERSHFSLAWPRCRHAMQLLVVMWRSVGGVPCYGTLLEESACGVLQVYRNGVLTCGEQHHVHQCVW